jgi:hypothetical protein
MTITFMAKDQVLFLRYIEILGFQDFMNVMISNPKNESQCVRFFYEGIDMLFKR